MINDDSAWLDILWEQDGLRSEGLGPKQEWDPVTPPTFQTRHDMFWKLVSRIIDSEPGEYDDLPDYLTETATEALQANT